jgi:hypothetical protein
MIEKIYIGTKIIAAEEMNEATFLLNVKHSKDQPVIIGSQGNSRPGYKVRYEDGYVSWSPKETFEKAYREVSMAEGQIILSAQNL